MPSEDPIQKRNKKALENGKFCEEYARWLYPEIEWLGYTCDAVLNGVKTEVKGCEAWISRSDKPHLKTRAGRIQLEKIQDQKIKSENGQYLCIVHVGDLFVKSFMVPAVNVDFEGRYIRAISWKSMEKLAGVC